MDDEDCFMLSHSTYHSLDSFGELSRVSSGMSLFIVHHNLRSFSRNYDELSSFLSEFNRDVDILVLTETWSSRANVGCIAGYNGYHSYRTDRVGGGVSVYVRETLNSSVIGDLTVNRDVIETCSVKVYNGSNFLYIIGVYRPPGDAGLDDFNRTFVSLLENSIIMRSNVFVLGDFNVDLLNLNPRTQTFVDSMRSLFLLPLITVPTRVTDTSETLIDNIWTNQLCIIHCGVFPVDISDHFPIFALPIFNTQRQTITHHFRDHSKRSLDELAVRVSDAVRIFANKNETGFNSRVEVFLNQFTSCYCECCPLRSKVLPLNSIRKPWITSDLRSMIKQKHNLFSQYRMGSVDFSFYNNFKNLVNKKLRACKREFFVNKFNNACNSSRSMWKSLRVLIGSKGNKPSIKLNIGEDEIDDPLIVASEFNEYFTGIANEIEAGIPVPNVDPLSYMGECGQDQSFYAFPSTSEEVSTVIRSFKNKGAALSEVPTFIYKFVCNIISPVIPEFFNESLTTGIFPDILKTARVVPIYKSGDSASVNNYRPISTLSVLSKIFESLMHRRVTSYIDKFRILADCQFGFRARSCTADAVTEYVDNVCSALDRKEHFVTVFLDFSKAFDTVDHAILIRKLDMLGFRGPINEWFRSYLSERRQCVSVGGVTSEYKSINRGVPQGSILGPVLFILYINDMHKACNLKFVHYADDTTVFISGANLAQLSETLNEELKKIDFWLQANRLSLNVSKSRVMITSKHSVPVLPAFKMRDVALKQTSTMKFLGVILDNNLSFRQHCSSVISALSRSLGVMRRIAPYISKKAIISLYYSLIYSKLTYAVVAWGNSSVVASKRILSIQRQFLKLLNFGTFSIDLFHRYSVLKFCYIYRYFCVIKLFNILIGSHRYFLNKTMLYQIDPQHLTRSVDAGILTNVYCRTSVSQRNFLYQGIKYWNELPLSIRMLSNSKLFKNHVRKHYLLQQSLSDDP